MVQEFMTESHDAEPDCYVAALHGGSESVPLRKSAILLNVGKNDN